MDSFEKREKSFEGKFAHDEELKFKLAARRNKLVALWAASKMYLEPAESEAYIQEVQEADFEKPGYEDVIEKVYKDLKKAGTNISEAEVRRELHAFAKQAEKEVKA